MKKFFSLAALSLLAAIPFTGCTTIVGVPAPDTDGRWNSVSGVLTARYPQNTVEDIFVATLKGLDQLGYYRTGENQPQPKDKQKQYVVFARAVGDVKITVTVYTARNTKAQTEWTQIDIQYGTWGNLKESQKIVDFISKNS